MSQFRLTMIETGSQSPLVGESEYRFETFSRTMNKQGASQTVRSDVKDRKDLPTRMLLQTFEVGEAVVVGTIDGATKPVTQFVMVDGEEEVASLGAR